MNILITGGAGFLGSNLTGRLLAAGHKVWVVDNLLTGHVENLEVFKTNPNFKFLRLGIETADFINFGQTVGVKLDQVYHLACATGVPNIQTLGEEMLLACSLGTLNVLRLATKHQARLVFTGSSEAYGDPLKTPQAETYTGNVDPTGLRANYEEGKRFSETLVMHFVRRHQLQAVIVRLFNVYGPNMALEDTRVIPRFVTQALTNQPLTVQGDGSQSRTLCFVTDILDGLQTVITKGIPGEVYNLGSDQSITVKNFAIKVIKLSGSLSGIEYVPRPAHDHASRMPVLDKIRAFGWNNQVDLTTGLKATIEDFRRRLELKLKPTIELAEEAEAEGVLTR